MKKWMVSVDPGVNALGWALWRWDPPHRKNLATPDECGIVNAPARLRMTPHQRVDYLADTLCERLDGMRPNMVVVEWAEFRAGDAVGHSAAARDDLGMLCFAAGVLCRWGLESHLAPVSKWKGSLPKRVVHERVVRAVGVEARNGERFNSHAVDAVGIGLWAKGFNLDDGRVFSRSCDWSTQPIDRRPKGERRW